MIPDSLWAIWCVWRRYFASFLKNLLYYLLTTFLEPIFWLLSFGSGLGSLVGGITTQGVHMTYQSFIFSGIVAQTVLFQGFFEGSYGAFVRMYYQKIFQAIAITPITLSEVLWGELLWDTSKAMVAAEVVVLIGVATGNFHPLSLVTVLPVVFAGSFLFSAIGLTTAGYSRTIDQLSYPQYLFIFPMFLFCGVFYPIESLPRVLQIVAWVFPLTSVNSLLRSLTLGLPLQPLAAPLLLVWLAVMVWVSRRSMFKRLVK